MSNQQTGKEGEKIAYDHLLKKGYQMLEQNWRFGRYEVDLIATKDNFLVIVEVKTRTSTDFGFPDEAVSAHKIDFLATAAAAYQDKNDLDMETRFDIISIVILNNHPRLFHIENAFHP